MGFSKDFLRKTKHPGGSAWVPCCLEVFKYWLPKSQRHLTVQNQGSVIEPRIVFHSVRTDFFFFFLGGARVF